MNKSTHIQLLIQMTLITNGNKNIIQLEIIINYRMIDQNEQLQVNVLSNVKRLNV